MTERKKKQPAGLVASAGQSTEEILKAMGSQVKALRLEKNWTQKVLADRADLCRSSIQKLEKGRGQLETLVVVLRALGVLGEVLAQLDAGISRKVRNKVLRGGRASSRGGYSK